MTAEAAPPRPDPWATTAPREAMRDLDEGRIVSLAPSVNLTPAGGEMVPVPYNVMDFGGHDDAYTPTVRFTGQRAMVLRSFSQHVHGDEAGTGGGVASGTCGGICEPIGHAALVRAEGSPVVRHLDLSWMNNRNTVGEAQFVRDTGVYPPPPDTDPLPGSARSGPGLGSRVMSDAGPDPSLSRPGAQLALFDPDGRFTASPPAQSAPPPSTTPLPSTAPLEQEPPPLAPPVSSGVGRWALRLLGRAAVPLAGGLAFHEADKDDGIGIWIDKNIPGAADVDDWVYRQTDGLVGRPATSKKTQVQRDYDLITKEEDEEADQNVRITGKREQDPEKRCILVPYGLLACPGDQSHHAVADRAFRSGPRQSGTWDTTGYIGGMSEGAGLAICLNGRASDPYSAHGRATAVYETMIRSHAVNGMVSLGVAEQAAALGVQAGTSGRCKAADVQAQLRAWHDLHGMGEGTLVRQQPLPLEPDHMPPLGSRVGGTTTR